MPADTVAAVSIGVPRANFLFPAQIRRLPFLVPSPKFAQQTETLPGSPADLLTAFSFSRFQNSLYICAGAPIIFSLIMLVVSSRHKYRLLIGRCHLNQMFAGSFSSGRSHRKDYANAALRANAIFDSDTISYLQRRNRSWSCRGLALYKYTITILKSSSDLFCSGLEFRCKLVDEKKKKKKIRSVLF